MSALGHKWKWRHARVMSVLPLKADIRQYVEHVCFVPIADMGRWQPKLPRPAEADARIAARASPDSSAAFQLEIGNG
jgi:hypothetical protein